MIGDELIEFARKVSTRQDFVKFVEYLNDDYQKNDECWENKTLPHFLGGLSAFANDMDGYYKNMGENIDADSITWRIAAEMLLASRVYEN